MKTCWKIVVNCLIVQVSTQIRRTLVQYKYFTFPVQKSAVKYSSIALLGNNALTPLKLPYFNL